MSAIDVRAALGSPHAAGERRLGAILRSALGVETAAAPASAPWDARELGLDRAAIFRDASAAEKRAILDRCARARLEESYFIEKAGLAYAAKMVLLSATTEERMLYSLFSGDEAHHLALVTSHLEALGGVPASADGNPFLSLLGGLIEDGDRDSLVFVVQVVLEGWGLTHYHHLARTTTWASLSASLEAILADEARHHGSGVVLFDEGRLSDASRRTIHDTLRRFLGMVAVGPQSVAAAVAEVKGGLSAAGRAALFTELGAEAHSKARLDLLQRLMAKAGAHQTIAALDAEGAFVPVPPEHC